MTRTERVYRAINHQAVDKVPKGEWQLVPSLVAEILHHQGEIGWEQQVAVRQRLSMDLVVLSADGQQDDFRRWRQETDFFIFALVDGPFQAVAKQHDFVEYLLKIGQRDWKIKEMVRQQMITCWAKVEQCLKAGAHGVMLAEDVAYAEGLFVPLLLMQQMFVPHWRQLVQTLRQRQVPVFLHSDGNIKQLLPSLTALGFTGIHSIDPLAGMDVGQVKNIYGNKLCLMGNVDVGFLSTATTDAITVAVNDLLTVAATGSGFILSTSTGWVGAEVPAANLIAMYQAAERLALMCRGSIH